MAIKIIFASSRYGKTSLMTHLLTEKTFDRDRVFNAKRNN